MARAAFLKSSIRFFQWGRLQPEPKTLERLKRERERERVLIWYSNDSRTRFLNRKNDPNNCEPDKAPCGFLRFVLCKKYPDKAAPLPSNQALRGVLNRACGMAL